MLIQLHIENFAIVDKLSLDFDPRLNVLTGETGAGKSILIDALRFVLGHRADQVRFHNDADKCSVEAVFEIPSAFAGNEVLDSFLSDDEDVFIIKREYSSAGKSRIWINHRLTTASAVKQISPFLIDIHGQHDHQRLFDKSAHLEILDRIGNNKTALEAYQTLFSDYAQALKEKKKLLSMSSARERDLDLLKFQIEELEKARFSAGEEEELIHERIRLSNSEKLYAAATQALELLDEADSSASILIGKSARDLHYLADVDPSLKELCGEFDDAQLRFEEVIRTLRDYQENLSFDPDRLQEIDDRMDQLQLIKRKYGGSLEKASEYLIESKTKYDALENQDVYVKDIEKTIASTLPALKELAADLSARRKKTALSIKKVIEKELHDLRITDAKFEAKTGKSDFTETGMDDVEFFMSLNAGQPMTEMRKVASGGEASRVMLALKKALVKVDPVGSLIFDEIDANIGGRLGTITGEKLKEIAQNRQVLLVTHLPQIASFADRHFKVSKVVREKKARAEYVILEGDERVHELSQMMSGQKTSDISKAHAKEMLTRAK